jgi:hypothetical protein
VAGARVGDLSTMPADLLPEPTRHELRLTAQEGKHGGPTWSYRGALIHSNRKQTLFYLEGEPADLPGGLWSGVGNKELLMGVLDSWIDHGKLPVPYLMPKT